MPLVIIRLNKQWCFMEHTESWLLSKKIVKLMSNGKNKEGLDLMKQVGLTFVSENWKQIERELESEINNEGCS